MPFFILMEVKQEILTRQDASFNNLKETRQVWDMVEQLFHGELNDTVSSKTKSQVFDPRISKLLQDRSYRVMAQLPVGKVKGISKNDMGDAIMKNLLLEKYVIPNAKAQFDFLTKLRMVDMYSGVYGAFGVLVDWDVRPDGYVGPDMWLLNQRDIFPQVGAVSVEDSDYIIVRTWQPLSFFENLGKQDGFKNVSKIVEKLKKKTGSKDTRDSENISKREEARYSEGVPAKGTGYFEVLSQFEGDRWSDLCVDADEVFRDADNPHDNGELPIVMKHSTPLLDDFFGIGDMERGAPMQKVINSVWNLYLDGVKMSIYPPVIINKENVASMSSIKWGAAEKWLGRGQINNIAQTLNLTPQGINTFNNTIQVANASLLSTFGTTDTSVAKEVDSTQGKTPQALKMQQAREAAGDAADRFHMEKFVENVMRKMCNLMAKKQPSQLSIRMFEDEIEEIKRSYPEVEEMYDADSGKLKVKKGGSGSQLYDYEIVSGSTFAIDQQAQQENLSSLVQLYMGSQTPQGNTLVNDLDKEGYILKFGEIFKRVVASSGIQDWDKILLEKTEEEKDATILQDDAQLFQQALQQMQMGGDMNGIPAQPGQGLPQQPQQPDQGIESGGMSL